MENNKSISISLSIVILTLGIILSSIWLGYLIQKTTNIQTKNSTMDSNVFTISQLANYLRMTEEEVQGIIDTEKNELNETGSFSGITLPYFTINKKQYFYKGEVDEWLKEVSNGHREYDTNGKQLFQ